MKADGSDQNTKGNGAVGAKPLTEEERARKTMQAQIAGMAKEFERALPGKIGVERMMRIVMTAILKNPKLAMCEPISFMGALLHSLQLGLEVNTPLGQAYLIPREKKDRNGKFLYWECNFQIGYQGLLDLCYRYADGKGRGYKMITAEVVYEGDFFDYRYGMKQFLDHRPEGKKDAKPTHVWALYELENGGQRFVVWTWEEVMSHGEEFSDSFNKEKPWASPWLKNETMQEEMAKKSVLKALLKYAPKSVELAQTIYVDGHAVIANKVEEAGGNMKLDFDVKQIAAPDAEMQDLMNKINNGGKRPEAETVSASGSGENVEEQPARAAASVPPQTERTAAPPPRNAPQTGPDKGNSTLFPADEAEALEEQFERGQGGVKPPDFD